MSIHSKTDKPASTFNILDKQTSTLDKQAAGSRKKVIVLCERHVMQYIYKHDAVEASLYRFNSLAKKSGIGQGVISLREFDALLIDVNA